MKLQERIQQLVNWAISRDMKPEDIGNFTKKNGDVVIYDKRSFKGMVLDASKEQLKEFKKKYNQQESQKLSEGSRPDRMEPVVPGRGGFLHKVWILLASLIKLKWR